MQNNTGNQGGKFVDRVQTAIMQFVILSKAQQGDVTKNNIQQQFRQGAFAQGNYQQHVDSCIQTLVQEGHLEQNGDKLTITDDGREDVQKLQSVVLELPQIVGNVGGQQQRQGMSAQRTSGGSTASGSTAGGSSTGGQNLGGTSGGNVPGRNR